MEKVGVGYTDYIERRTHYKTVDDVLTLWALFSAELFGEVKIHFINVGRPSISLPLEDCRNQVKKIWGKA